MLKTRCIKSTRQTDDGWRISIMSRHTKNDGVTPDEDITNDSYDEWWSKLSPAPKLVGDYYRGTLSWEDFAIKFNEFLKQPNTHDKLMVLVSLAKVRNITILCIEDGPEYCHRRLVAERCLELDNTLELVIE
ncbi:MAG: DUF488 family protein [Candidatus Falkowbacteria bacterium]